MSLEDAMSKGLAYAGMPRRLPEACDDANDSPG